MEIVKEYQLTFTESEVNDVLTGIGNYFNYVKAKPLIAKIGLQIKEANDKFESENGQSKKPVKGMVKSKK